MVMKFKSEFSETYDNLNLDGLEDKTRCKESIDLTWPSQLETQDHKALSMQ